MIFPASSWSGVQSGGVFYHWLLEKIIRTESILVVRKLMEGNR